MMKALIFDEPRKPAVVDVQSPGIDENQVLVRSRRVGICHSDYELLAGQYIIPISYPVIPGHEWVGEIVEVGRNVTALKAGDRVVGECVINTPERIHHFGFSMDGANREYFAARPEWLHKLPDAVDDRKGALIEPFTCGYYAVLRNGGTNASETVVISGGGNHRPRLRRRRDRHGRARDRGRSRSLAPRHRQAPRRRRDGGPLRQRSRGGGEGDHEGRRGPGDRSGGACVLARQRV